MLAREQALIQNSLQAQMELNHLDALLLTSPEGVYYATGMASLFLYASNRVGTALAVVPKSGRAVLVCSEFESNAARSQCGGVEIVTYPTWIYIADFEAGAEKAPQPDPFQSMRVAVEIIRQRCPAPGRIGLEWDTIPHRHMGFLQEQFGPGRLADCEKALTESRAFKTPWEISVLQRGAVCAERMMYETARQTEAGMNEADLLSLWNRACCSQGKDVHGMFAAHTFADQFSPVMIPRTAPALKDGDIVRLDGGPRIWGYTSDLARTYVVGGRAAAEREEIFQTLLNAHDHAFERIGPGVRIRDIFQECMAMVRKKIPAYSRGHIGHSIGVSAFTEEAPFISSREDRVFAPGMVFCLELPYYSSFNSSYNLEDTFVVTENGIRRFTHTNRSLIWP